MKLSDLFFHNLASAKVVREYKSKEARETGLSPEEKFVLIDAIRRWCLAQRADEIGPGGSTVPVRLRWARGIDSAGLSQEAYNRARKNLVAAGLLDRCRDGDRMNPDSTPKLMRFWFRIRIG